MLDLTKIIKKSDIVTPGKLKPISKKSPNMTGEIMKGVTDVVSLIKNIEKYSDDNKLQFGKRIPYAIYTENTTIEVAQSYFINDKTLCVIGWSPTGFGTQIYNNGKVDKTIQDVSTYVLPVDCIHCVTFGSYDPEKIKIEETKKVNISEKELEVSLNELKTELTSLQSTGWARDFIIKAKIGMVKYYMLEPETAKELFNNHKIMQLSQDIARMYHDKLENIIYYFLSDDKTNFMFNYMNDKELIRKYRFFKTEEERLHYVEASRYERTGSNQKNTFTFDEVKEFAEFFEDENITKQVEEQMKLPKKTKVEIKLNDSNEVLTSIEYYDGYENNPGISVFSIVDLIPVDNKVKEADSEYTYVFMGISTTKDATIAMGLQKRITESSTVYLVFKAVPIKTEEEEPPVVDPPTEPDDPDGGDDTGEGGEDPDPKDPITGGEEGDEDNDGDEEPEPEPDPEEEDEEDEPEPEDEDPEETSDDEDEDDQDTDDTEESDKTDPEE